MAHYARCNIPIAHARTHYIGTIGTHAETQHPKHLFSLSCHCSLRPNILFLKQGKSLGPVTLTVLSGTLASLRLENNAQVRSLFLLQKSSKPKLELIVLCLIYSCVLVFATNFRVKAAMKNSILLSWEIRDKNPSQPFTVRRFSFNKSRLILFLCVCQKFLCNRVS